METIVHIMKSLVEYQEGTIVSKSIISKDSGSITIFAFDKGQELSEHTAPYDAFLQVIDGKAEIRISSEKYNLVSGEIIIMPANELHAVKAIDKFKMMLIMIKE